MISKNLTSILRLRIKHFAYTREVFCAGAQSILRRRARLQSSTSVPATQAVCPLFPAPLPPQSLLKLKKRPIIILEDLFII